MSRRFCNAERVRDGGINVLLVPKVEPSRRRKKESIVVRPVPAHLPLHQLRETKIGPLSPETAQEERCQKTTQMPRSTSQAPSVVANDPSILDIETVDRSTGEHGEPKRVSHDDTIFLKVEPNDSLTQQFRKVIDKHERVEEAKNGVRLVLNNLAQQEQRLRRELEDMEHVIAEVEEERFDDSEERLWTMQEAAEATRKRLLLEQNIRKKIHSQMNIV